MEFSFSTSDPEGHDVYFYIMWGDNTHDDWSGPYSSGDKVTINHTYTQGGQIFINAMAKDQFEKEGEQIQFRLFIIKERTLSKSLLYRFLERLFERFPNLEVLIDKIYN